MTELTSASSDSAEPGVTSGMGLDAQATRLLAKALNHLLVQEPWAQHNLRSFSSQVVRLDLVPLQVNLKIQADGQVSPAGADHLPSVTVTVPLSAMPMIAADYANAGQAGVMKHVRLEGDAELANTVSLLVRNLRWEVAEDLSLVMGDVAAQRVVSGAARLHHYALQTLRDVRDSVAEYLTDEQPRLVTQLELHRFGADVSNLRNDLARFEKRLERLESRLPARVGQPAAARAADSIPSSQSGPA
jgi:ubiquinone biosynthesis protein UbiJ